MWFSSRIKFPYPVLSPGTGDFLDRTFDIEISVSEMVHTGEVELAYSVKLDQSNVEKHVRDEDARLGLFVVCPTTYFSKLYEIKLGGGKELIKAGELLNRVELRPVIFTESSYCAVPHCSIHDEFGDNDWGYEEHQFLAIGDLQVINVGLDKLAPMETIFMLAKKKDIPKGEIQIQTEGEKVSIVVNDDTFNKIHNLRAAPVGKAVLLNSVYLPAIMSLLDTIKSGPAGYEERRWYKVFIAKCELLDIDIKNGDLLAGAQKLLKLPLERLVERKELQI